MTAFDYARSKATAERLIARFGAAQVLRKAEPGTGPAHNPGPSTPTDYAANMVLLEYSNRERDGTRILANDKKVLVSTEGLSVSPAPQDQLVINGATYSAVTVKPLMPGPTVLLWEVQARG